MENITKVVNSGLCLGCGICQDVCSKNCIRILKGRELNKPIVLFDNCSECKLCLKICPGQGIDISFRANQLFNEKCIEEDKYLGRYLSCYSGYSNDYDVRYHSASGGMVSQFLIYLLESKVITGAVVVGFMSKDPMKPHVYIAKTKNEILAGRSSKYCVVSYETIVRQVQEEKGKYVIVGLPCHIHAFRKYESIFKVFKEYVIGYFSLFCSATKNYLSQEYLLYRYNINKNEIKSFSYRDDGCMGYMKFINHDDKVIKKIPCLSYYIPMRGFFNAARCSLCIDHYGELADVCFGDLHVGEYAKDTIGVNSIIVRNHHWNNLLKQASDKEYVTINKISFNLINSSQGYIFKHKKGPGIVAAFMFRKILLKRIPVYDIPFISNLQFKYLIREIRNYVSRFIGRYPSLWFIIKMLDNPEPFRDE